MVTILMTGNRSPSKDKSQKTQKKAPPKGGGD